LKIVLCLKEGKRWVTDKGGANKRGGKRPGRKTPQNIGAIMEGGKKDKRGRIEEQLKGAVSRQKLMFGQGRRQVSGLCYRGKKERARRGD